MLSLRLLSVALPLLLHRLLLVLLILLVRGLLLLLNVSMLRFARCLLSLILLLVLLLRRLGCPVLVLLEPIRMMGIHLTWILLVPPLPVVPDVLLVVVAITVAPAWVE
jgi:hypothetical protein